MEKKTFLDWIISINSKHHEAVVYDIVDNNIRLFKDFKTAYKHLGYFGTIYNMTNVLHPDKGILKYRYRIFDKSFYDKNKDLIHKLPRFSNKYYYSQEINNLKRHVTYDGSMYIFPTQKDLSDFLSLNVNTVSRILRNKANSNPFNIRFAYTHSECEQIAVFLSEKRSIKRDSIITNHGDKYLKNKFLFILKSSTL